MSWSAVPSSSYDYGQKITAWKFTKLVSDMRARIKKVVLEIRDHRLVGFIFDRDQFMEMPGVAIVATYLKRKHALAGLYVATSLEAVRDFLNSHEEGRFAIVLPDESEHIDKRPKGLYYGDPGHKVAVCVEKSKEQSHVVFFDSLGTDAANFEKSHESQKTRHAPDQEAHFEGKGPSMVLDYILTSTLDRSRTKYYFVRDQRQLTGYSCESFALRDSVSFLQDQEFFSKIQCEERRVNEIVMHEVVHLPPAFMKGSQNPYALQQFYEKAAPNETELLNTTLEKHAVIIEKVNYQCAELLLMMGNCFEFWVHDLDSRVSVSQNHYMNKRSIKYHQIVLKALAEMSEAELRSVINETCLFAPTKRGLRAKL